MAAAPFCRQELFHIVLDQGPERKASVLPEPRLDNASVFDWITPGLFFDRQSIVIPQCLVDY